ncbi:hypothetical protein B1756_12765 [Natrarchaeobaculum aegyptiacum]|uniref:DUF4386 family protein n=1 Tax=Natrarchaeobaculum aegyptiacum TaxID=745377 RepID=A0A2Z2HTI1_9EURY|nr:hypothetical protein B1756_12765 [Natrarchaeobaculum aegyptiacum]
MTNAIRWLVLLGTPIALGVVLAVHPHGGENLYESLTPVADQWFHVHVALLPLFGLLGVSVYLLLAEYAGRLATIGRIGVAVYLVAYLAFEAIAGLATGLLVRSGQGLPSEQQAGVAAALEAMATDPLVAALVLIGSAGITVSTIALGVLLRRSGAPLVPVLLLAGIPLVVVGHGGGYVDVVGAAMVTLSVAWLEFGWQGQYRSATSQAA